MGQLKYPLPTFADGELTPYAYSHWVVGESADAYRRDCEKMRPFALKSSQKQYGNVIHEAVVAGNGIDPFTGDRLRFDLVHTYDPVRARGDIGYERQFDLMPNVDHIDPEADFLALEICSKRINLCKSEQNPEEFLNMCRTIMEHCGKKVDGRNPQPNLLPFTGEGASELRGHARFDTSINSVHCTAQRKQGPEVDDKNKRPLNLSPPFLPQQGELANGTPFTFPAVYLLPGYLEGRCPQVIFTKWVDRTAETRLVRDRKIKRPYAIAAHMLLYKQIIYRAALIGEFDPFTGELLQWELIGQLDPAKTDPNSVNFKRFALLPTVDHINPASDILQMEMCSLKINACKGNLNPQEFIELCRRVLEYRRKVDPSTSSGTKLRDRS